MRLRYGLDGPEKTLEEVGKEFGLTRERIRQVQAKTIPKLARWLRELGYGPSRSPLDAQDAQPDVEPLSDPAENAPAGTSPASMLGAAGAAAAGQQSKHARFGG